MGKVLITDHALEQAAASVSKAILNAIPSAEECRHEFSQEFEAKIQRLKEKEHRRAHRRSIARRVAAVFLAIVLGAGVWLATDSQARAAVAKWFREVYETHIVYRFTGEAPGGELPTYKPTWVPDGYEEVNVIGTETIQTLVYQKGEDAFTITYYWMSEDRIAQLIGTNGEGELISVGRNQGHYYPRASADTTNDLIWADESANIQFAISAFLEEEDIVKIAESITCESTGNHEDKAVTGYRLGWLPEGYEEAYSVSDDGMTDILYIDTNNSEKGIIFSYYQTHSGMVLEILEPTGESHEVWVNGLPGHFYPAIEANSTNALIWIDEENKLIFSLSSYFGEEDMLHMAEGIVCQSTGDKVYEAETGYRLGWTPDGYVESFRTGEVGKTNIIYVNMHNEEEGIIFSYYQTHGGMALGILEPTGESREIRVNGLPGHFYPAIAADNTNELIWIDEENQLVFSLSSYFGEEDMLHIAENIVVEKMTN